MRITSGYRVADVRGGAAPNSAHLDRIVRTLQRAKIHIRTLRCPKDERSDGKFVRARREFDSQWRSSFKKDIT